MVTEDRRLRLAGYEVYRFGGYELCQDPETAEQVVTVSSGTFSSGTTSSRRPDVPGVMVPGREVLGVRRTVTGR
jgi:hypothetical protein